jgi:hypothetical protein
MQFGRDREGGDAIALISVDQDIDAPTLAQVQSLPLVIQVKPLVF